MNAETDNGAQVRTQHFSAVLADNVRLFAALQKQRDFLAGAAARLQAAAILALAHGREGDAARYEEDADACVEQLRQISQLLAESKENC